MMRPKEPTCWLLHGRNHWDPAGDPRRKPTLDGVSAGERSGIRLAGDKAGPLALHSADGSLGGLVLPRGMAIDADGILYLLVRAEPPHVGEAQRRKYQIKRFDPIECAFIALPSIGGAGAEPRQFFAPRNIAIAGRNLYVADRGNRRVQVFDLDSLALRHIWAKPWFPVDVAAQAGAAYILDRRYGRVYRHRPGSDGLELVLNVPKAARRWRRIAVDRDGRIYLLNSATGALDIYDRDGRPQGEARAPGDIADNFDAPAVRVDHRGRFCIPEDLARPCDRRTPGGPAIETPLALCPPPRRPPAAPWWFTPGDLVAGALALALKQPRDPLSRFLRGLFSSETRRLIDTYGGGAPSGQLAQALCDELNRIIQDRDLYSERRFACVVLSQEIKQMIGRAPRGRERTRLNRLLLEAAYPAAFVIAQAPPERLIFDLYGRHMELELFEPAGPRIYTLSGTWTSSALDSQLYRCQWHRIELELLDLPPGTQVLISTYTDDQPIARAEVPSQLWKLCCKVQGPVQSGDPRTKPELKHEFLVQSREGQYLWLRIELSGDGYATPAVGALRVQYPRESYLSYLPPVYSADDESRWFLERFLSIFQTDWDAIEQEIADIARYFDPAAVPEGKPLAYLASWLALPLEGGWSEAQKRRLLIAAPQIYPNRGTPAGLREYLRVYLRNIRGDDNPKPEGATAQAGYPGYPLIVEGFRERRRLMLGAPGGAVLGEHAPPLWGPAQVGRLQLDVFAREGDVRLVSVGDPERDLFHEYAHHFRVYIPAAWVRSADQERLVRRAIEAEKPAHTRYELCLVEPRYRVGLQSTVGVDTIIGAYPRARLACRHAPAAPPSQAPRGILGYDTVLGGAGGLGLRPHTRIGIDTRLT